MKVVIFGASGRTGKHMVELALERGYEVVAFVRRENSIEIEHPNLKVLVGSLLDTNLLKEAMQDANACLSVLGGGSLTKHGNEVIAGIEHIVIAMESVGVDRLIYLSSAGAGESRYYMPQPLRFLIADVILRIPLADHTTNEKRIQSSSLNWTIVQPGSLSDGALVHDLNHGSGKTIFKGNAKTSRASVASFMLQQLTDNTYNHKCVWIQG